MNVLLTWSPQSRKKISRLTRTREKIDSCHVDVRQMDRGVPEMVGPPVDRQKDTPRVRLSRQYVGGQLDHRYRVPRETRFCT